MLAKTIALSILGLLLAAPAATAKVTWQDQPSVQRVTASGVLLASHQPRVRSPRDGRSQARRFDGDRRQGRGEGRGEARRFGGDQHPGLHRGQVRRFDRDWRRGRHWRGPRGRFGRRDFRRMPPRRYFYGRRGPGRPYNFYR